MCENLKTDVNISQLLFWGIKYYAASFILRFFHNHQKIRQKPSKLYLEYQKYSNTSLFSSHTVCEAKILSVSEGNLLGLSKENLYIITVIILEEEGLLVEKKILLQSTGQIK